MKLEVLVATMHQTDFSKLEEMNIQSDAVVVNQCDRNSMEEFFFHGYRVLWINSVQRGLSRSRNMAISYASGDICLLADDDIVYYDDYPGRILDVFRQLSDADFIAFNTNMLNTASKRVPVVRTKRSGKNKYYGSVRLAFRRKCILEKGLRFNECFGTGAKYSSGEESLFLRDARKNGLRVYEHPLCICDVDYSSSSWFKGFTAEYYFSKGAFLAAAYGKSAWLYSAYYLLKSIKHSNLGPMTVLKYIFKGIHEYRGGSPDSNGGTDRDS